MKLQLGRNNFTVDENHIENVDKYKALLYHKSNVDGNNYMRLFKKINSRTLHECFGFNPFLAFLTLDLIQLLRAGHTIENLVVHDRDSVIQSLAFRVRNRVPNP